MLLKQLRIETTIEVLTGSNSTRSLRSSLKSAAIVYPALEGFYFSSSKEGATLPSLLGIRHREVMVFVYLMAPRMFYVMERHKRTR